MKKAMTPTPWIVFDDVTFGMNLSGKVVALYSKVEWNIGSAAYFGQNRALFCKDVERSFELFANFKPKSDFHLNCGQNRAKMMIKNCGK